MAEARTYADLFTGQSSAANIDWDTARSADVDSRFGVHDSNQMELKLDYAVDPRARWTQYQTEAFIFIPQSLGINRHSYTRDQFFADMQAYIRFKTPRLPMAALVDPTVSHSPLNRIRLILESVGGARFEQADGTLSRELRMLGCLVRANLRDTTAAVRRRLAELEGETNGRRTFVADVCASIKLLLDDLEAVRTAFRSLRQALVNVNGPPWLRTYFEHTDEFLSISIESYLTELLSLLQTHNLRRKKFRAHTEPIWVRLVELITAEQAHRMSSGYDSRLHDQAGREAFVRRYSYLKKFVASVLFLRIRSTQEGMGFAQIAACIAAAVAMAFSVSAAFVSERLWGLNSLPFVSALIVAYVFKDRIKDLLKSYFYSKVACWLPDRSMDILDPENGRTIGRCRELFAHQNPDGIPPFVTQWRGAHTSCPENGDSEREVVLHYSKAVALRGKHSRNAHGNRRGINDIIRWNIASLLARMDDPERLVPYFDPASADLKSAECPKHYELNVILVLRASGRLVSVERYRLLVDRRGIHSLESVDVTPAKTQAERRQPRKASELEAEAVGFVAATAAE